MATILAYGGTRPTLGRDVFVAPNATVVGDVVVGDESSLWFGCVLRGDVAWIRIGARTNIQDLGCIHVTGGVSNVEIGDEVTVGHGVTLHGCTVGDGGLIGIGSVVLDRARIGEGAVVAAGALVPPGMIVPPRTVVRGVPAKPCGPVPADQARLGIETARNYVELAARYRQLFDRRHAGRDATTGG